MKNQAILHWKTIKRKTIAIKEKSSESLYLWRAKIWQKIYLGERILFNFKSKYSVKLGFISLVVIIIVSAIFAQELLTLLEPYFSKPEQLTSIKALFLSLGCAMIGATAIAFSLIMFAMQVNVERMPYGLFKKFSSDTTLLGTFTFIFVLAFSIIVCSLIPDKSWVSIAILITVWSSLLIILLFMFAYRRALTLISPTKQLVLVVTQTQKDFKKWNRTIERSIPIIQGNLNSDVKDYAPESNHDMCRVLYFQKFPQWTSSALQAISYCIIFSRRYAEQGDHEVSRFSLNAIVEINSLYIRTKGKTFFSNNYLFNNPLASDNFLTNTLEHLRQNIQVGISQKDEQFIEQNLVTLLKLTELYLFIEYGSAHETRTHAHLVSSYLSSAVESIIPHGMVDVLMEGVSLLGQAGRLIVHNDKPEHIDTISEKITLIACTGTAHKNFRPITEVAVKQLAILTFETLLSKSWEVNYGIKKIRDNVKLIAMFCLKIPELPLERIHSTCLAPYYSGTSNDTLMAWLTELANVLTNAKASDEVALRVVGHIDEWADELYQTEKELLLLAIDKRSQLTFDLIHWIVHITKLLFAVSCSDVCADHHRDNLRNSSYKLISVLSFIPDNQETIKFIETFNIADKIFESAVDAYHRSCDNEAIQIQKLLLNWTFKVGKYQTGWGSLEKACCGLACLNLILALPDESLLTNIKTYVSNKDAPNIDIRSKVASQLHKKATKSRTRYGHNSIDMAMASVDQSRLSTLLHGIADNLYP